MPGIIFRKTTRCPRTTPLPALLDWRGATIDCQCR
jgi:hypothetical protein